MAARTKNFELEADSTPSDDETLPPLSADVDDDREEIITVVSPRARLLHTRD